MLLLVGVTFAALVAIILFIYPRDRVGGLVGILVMSAIVLVPTIYVESQTAKNAALAVTVGGTAMLSILKRPAEGSLRRAWPYVVYFAIILASTLLHPTIAKIGSLVTVAVPALSLLLVTLITTTVERAMMVRFMIGLSIVEALYAILYTIGVVPRLWNNTTMYPHELVEGLARGEGTLGHPLMLALLLLIAITLVLGGQVTSRGGARVALLLVLFAGLFATGSRSSLIIATVFVVFSLGSSATTRLFAGVTTSSLLVIGLAIIGFFSGNLVVNFLEGNSVGHRRGALDAVPKLLNQRPMEVIIGNGAGSTVALFRKGLLQDDMFYAIDNQIVWTIATAGVIGLSALILLILNGVKVERRWRMPVLAVVTFFFVFDVLAWPAGAALFGLTLGLAAIPSS